MLALPRVGVAVDSTRELLALIDWLGGVDADLIVVDARLDSGSDAGRASIALVRELDRLDRARRGGASGVPRPGRPGISDRSPELAAELAAMRGRGMSLQAIADDLNRRGTPTPRGGTRWRPSSVQSALGYRRPVGPGLPPLPGSRGPGPPRGPGGAPEGPHGPGGPPPPSGGATGAPWPPHAAAWDPATAATPP